MITLARYRLATGEFSTGLSHSAWLLYGLVRSLQPETCVEIGSARGLVNLSHRPCPPGKRPRPALRHRPSLGNQLERHRLCCHAARAPAQPPPLWCRALRRDRSLTETATFFNARCVQTTLVALGRGSSAPLGPAGCRFGFSRRPGPRVPLHCAARRVVSTRLVKRLGLHAQA